MYRAERRAELSSVLGKKTEKSLAPFDVCQNSTNNICAFDSSRTQQYLPMKTVHCLQNYYSHCVYSAFKRLKYWDPIQNYSDILRRGLEDSFAKRKSELIPISDMIMASICVVKFGDSWRSDLRCIRIAYMMNARNGTSVITFYESRG